MTKFVRTTRRYRTMHIGAGQQSPTATDPTRRPLQHLATIHSTDRAH
jgi:hypothetical protein